MSIALLQQKSIRITDRTTYCHAT